MSSITSSSSSISFWFGPRLADEAACGDFVAVSRYLRAGDDVNEKNQLGGSSLIVAAQYGHFEVVQTLLRDRKIDVNLQDNSGETALMKAASEGHKKIVKTLVKRRDIDLNIQDGEGWTTLMHARGKMGIVKILLKLPTLDIMLTNHSDYNAFQRASRNGWTQVVTAIVRSARFSKQLTKEDLKDAEKLAKNNGYAAVAKVILMAVSARDKKITRKRGTG